MLTPEEKAEYVRCNGARCPYCKSDQVEYPGMFQDEGGFAFAAAVCLKCHNEWTDEYKLVRIIEEGEDD